jgi:hypothetical protein
MNATFVMSNMTPQAPDLNRGTWERLESYCRDQVRDRPRDLYIVAGPAGRGGWGSEGYRTLLRGARGKIVMPGKWWKVILAVPTGTDPRKVSAEEARVWAVIMPNMQGLNPDWRSYAVRVRDVEELTGFTFFSNLPTEVAEQLRTRQPQTRAKSEKPVVKEKKDKSPRKKGKTSELELPAFVEGCVIGNRQSKKYHVPTGSGYQKARKSKNAVFFKNAQDAEKAGYTAAKR